MKPILFWLGTSAALIAALLVWYLWLPPLLLVLLVRHLRKPKSKRLEPRVANQESSRKKFEDRYLPPLLQRYGLPDSEANRVLLKRWLEHQAEKSRQEKKARDAA